MKMYCAYGVDKPVERAYLYLRQHDEAAINATTQSEEATREEGVPLQWAIATEISNSTTFMDSGVRKGNGDGTVPLISLGIHCRRGWKTKKLNPGGIAIKTRELKHSPVPMYQDPRGGPWTSDHVDVLGNHGLLDLLLHVASGNGDKIEDQIVSDIDDIAAKIDF
jgi:phospholipid:diacylglycerol acyltransferase